MATEIYDHIPGRAIATYDLLDEIQDTHNLPREDAHDAIHAMLEGIISTDGNEVILDRRPTHPERLTSNPNNLDIRYWLTISDETATTIREALAAAYADA